MSTLKRKSLELVEAIDLVRQILGRTRFEVEAEFQIHSITDDDGCTEEYIPLVTKEGQLSLCIGFEDGILIFCNLVGEIDPSNQNGKPSVTWVAARPAVEEWRHKWSQDRRVKDRKIGGKDGGRQLFFEDTERDPLRIALGPSFPRGVWNDETRALHVLAYRVEREVAVSKSEAAHA